MNIKTFLVYTNPISIVVGIPIFSGMFVAAMFDGVAKRTKYLMKKFDDIVMK